MPDRTPDRVVRKPIDYRDRFIVVDRMCDPGKGETFRFFYHSKGRLCTALAIGDGRVINPGDHVYYRDLKENALATPAQTRQYERPPADKETPDIVDLNLL